MNAQLLKKHLNETPRMAPTDAVKLAYQCAFGCGHLLSARDCCADFVCREMQSVPERNLPPFTPIGRGLCRLNLAAPEVRRLSPEMIADMMIITNEKVLARSDNAAAFEESLALLEELAEAGETPFTVQELSAYLASYRAQGCPAVSHSPLYRESYHPAYRVVLSDFGVLLPLILRMNEAPCLAVIDGPCGSGKTTLAGLLAALYGTTPIPMDDFFLPFDMRTEKRMSEAGGNIHHERFSEEILAHIQLGKPLAYRRFDCHTGQIIPREIAASDVMIIEGSYSHHPAFEEAYARLNAIRAFVSVEDQEQLIRLEKRNPHLLERFVAEWIPLEKNYFEAYDRKQKADLVLLSRSWDA